jgi:hypothetical protein
VSGGPISDPGKLRRNSAFRCTEPQLQGVQRPENSLKEFKVPKAQEGQRFYTHRRGLKSQSSQRKRSEGRGLWTLGILPSAGRKRQNSGGATTVVGSAEKIWTIEDFASREQQEECKSRRDSEPLDLAQNSRQPSDLSRGARGLNPRKQSESPEGVRIGISTFGSSGVRRTRVWALDLRNRDKAK